MKNHISLICLFLIVSVASSAQTDSIAVSNWKFKIDSTYTSLIKKNKIVGASIAIVQNGEIVYAEGFGYQHKSDEIKADANTIYRIGSISKSFTDLAIMQLQEEGKLKISDPMQKYLPQLKIQSRFTDDNRIIIADVMTHTAGLPSDLLNGFFCDNPPTIDWTIGQINNCTMSAPAGYQHSYSNVGYGMLGRLIETVSAQDYDTYLKEHIFEPLKMNSSGVKLSESLSEQISKGYVDGKEIDETQIRDAAAGLISCSVLDMANYINMYLANGKVDGKQFLSENSIEDMRLNKTGDINLPTPSEWGYGLYSSKISIVSKTDTLHTKIVGHGGDTWAFHADFQFIPELNIGAVILTNTDNGVNITSAKNLIRQYLKETEGKQLVPSLDSLNKRKYDDQVCTADEVKGFYFLGGDKIEVKKTNKFKLKQGVNTIVFKEINDSLMYHAKVRLLGFIPIKVKNQSFKFVKHNDEIFLKGKNAKSKSEDYISKKTVMKPLSAEWEKSLGRYEVIGETYPCKDCPYLNFETFSITLKKKKGMLVAYTKGKSKDTKGAVILDVISEKVSVTPGIGRNTGATVRLLDNGNLFYEGFELKKM